MKVYNDIEQNSDEWFALRMGKVTGSCFKDATAGGQGKTRLTLMYKLIAERLSSIPQETYKNPTMERGNEVEPFAREEYEKMTGTEVKQVGFIEFNEDIGCSPDGLIGDDGLAEIKCPNSSTHIRYILEDRLPNEYKKQVQGQLWVSERQWCDFVSYDPRVNARPIWIYRVERDEKIIDELKSGIERFVSDMKKLIETVRDSPF